MFYEVVYKHYEDVEECKYFHSFQNAVNHAGDIIEKNHKGRWETLSFDDGKYASWRTGRRIDVAGYTVTIFPCEFSD